MEEKVIKIDIEETYERAQSYMDIMCGFNRDSGMAVKSKVLAQKVREQNFNGMKMPFLVKGFGRQQINGEYFEFDNVKIKCTALNKFEKDNIYGGYVFLFRSPMPDIYSLPVSKMYLADSWETCFVDAGRDILREKLLKEAAFYFGKTLYITDTLAPGMAGMPSDSVKEFFKFMDAEKIGIKLMDSGMMNPVKSFVGIYLVIDKEHMVSTMNCNECLSGHKFCEYCKNYASVYMGENFNPQIQMADKSIMKQWGIG